MADSEKPPKDATSADEANDQPKTDTDDASGDEPSEAKSSDAESSEPPARAKSTNDEGPREREEEVGAPASDERSEGHVGSSRGAAPRTRNDERAYGPSWLPLAIAFVLPILFFFILPPLTKSGLWDPYELNVADLARRVALNLHG